MILKYSRRESRGQPPSRREKTAMDAKEPLIRIVLLALLIYASLFLARARQELYDANAAEAALRARLEIIEQDNLAVRNKLAEGWSAEELEAMAREKLGLVLPGDKIFRFSSDVPDASG
jgi:cell division protein FtsB